MKPYARCDKWYAEGRAWKVADEYVDSGWSGAKAERPELRRLMQDARKRRFDAVLVWKPDRWGRSVADSIKRIQELASLGIRFIRRYAEPRYRRVEPDELFLLHVMAAFAEPERELIRERTVAGVHAAKANGKRFGRPQRVFRRDEVVRLRDGEKLSWRKISDRLGVAIGTVRDAYAGQTAPNRRTNHSAGLCGNRPDRRLQFPKQPKPCKVPSSGCENRTSSAPRPG